MAGHPPIHPHGVVRGLDKIQASEQFDGRFGRLFRTLPPAQFTDDDLAALAQAMVAKADTPTPEDQVDDEENTGTPSDPGISAGYTYLGQFIDHDLTFDPASSLQKQNDPDALVDFRTPALRPRQPVRARTRRPALPLCRRRRADAARPPADRQPARSEDS